MKASQFAGLGLTVGFLATMALAASAAQIEHSEKIFDGGNIVCAESANIGSPGVVVKKTGQEIQEDGILLSFEVTSKVCAEKNGKLEVRDSLPLQVLPSGAVLSGHELVFTTDSSEGLVKTLGAVDIEGDKVTTQIDILVPQSMRNKNIDSFLRVKLTDVQGPTQATFGAFRHHVN